MTKYFITALLFPIMSFKGISQGLYDNYKLTFSAPISTYNAEAANERLRLMETIRKEQLERMEKEEQERKEREKALIKQTKLLYESKNDTLTILEDGWYNVTVTNNIDYCKERKVLVENNKITKYVMENCFEKKIVFATEITKCKSVIKLEIKDKNTEYLDVYFMESVLSNRSVKTSAPEIPGAVTFWCDFKKAGKINIYINDDYAGELNSYFNEEPTCANEGTVSYNMKPGKYTYKASNSNSTWEDSFVITSDKCTKILISR